MAGQDFSFTIAEFGRKSAANVGAREFSVLQIRELQRRLKAIDPALRTALVRDIKAIGKPLQTAVKDAIPAVAPLSGMAQGRLQWDGAIDSKGKAHKPRDVKIQFRTRSSGKAEKTSLLRLQVASPAVVMADMAGRSGNSVGKGYKNSGYTREYPYRNSATGKRRHRVTTQGQRMIENLGGRGSRYAWPAAERSIPAISEAINKVLKSAYDRINSKGL